MYSKKWRDFQSDLYRVGAKLFPMATAAAVVVVWGKVGSRQKNKIGSRGTNTPPPHAYTDPHNSWWFPPWERLQQTISSFPQRQLTISHAHASKWRQLVYRQLQHTQLITGRTFKGSLQTDSLACIKAAYLQACSSRQLVRRQLLNMQFA